PSDASAMARRLMCFRVRFRSCLVSSSSAMSLSWVNLCPVVKQHITRAMRKDLPMPKAAVTPRKRLAENLQVLMKTAEKSSPEIAEAAQIGRKTMNNFLNGRFDPRLTLVEKVANTFGLTTWQLLAMDLSAIPAQPKQVLTLLERF